MQPTRLLSMVGQQPGHPGGHGPQGAVHGHRCLGARPSGVFGASEPRVPWIPAPRCRLEDTRGESNPRRRTRAEAARPAAGYGRSEGAGSRRFRSPRIRLADRRAAQTGHCADASAAQPASVRLELAGAHASYRRFGNSKYAWQWLPRVF